MIFTALFYQILATKQQPPSFLPTLPTGRQTAGRFTHEEIAILGKE